ncbi:hypothetical protein C8R47DRAFT_746719 [Mycena vitilis]|nr:hypothetical protein C8R47DRAFT_746719 [Mycena vitilis]
MRRVHNSFSLTKRVAFSHPVKLFQTYLQNRIHFQAANAKRTMTSVTDANKAFLESCWKPKTDPNSLPDTFSCDWINWNYLSFFSVLPYWHNVTTAELVFNLQYKLPKPIIPLAYLRGLDEPHFAFEAGSEYYYYEGSTGQLRHYTAKGQFSSVEDFLSRFDTDGQYEVMESLKDPQAIADEIDEEQMKAAAGK